MDPIIESANVRGKIIVFKDSVTDVNAAVTTIVTKHRVGRDNVYKDCIKGFNTGLISETQCSAIITQNPDLVDAIYDDFEVTAWGQLIPWNIRRVGATDEGSSAGIGKHVGDKNVDVFLLDTGCCLTSPDLNVVENRSFLRSEGVGCDVNGHGTAVASIISARDNDALAVGVAAGARIHSYKVLDKTGIGIMSQVIAALEAVVAWKRGNPAIQNGLVVNMSFGAFVGVAKSVLDRALEGVYREGITVVVAAGNHGADISLYSPARAGCVLTVGAYDKTNTMCAWSNYGEGVDFLAPGANVMTLYRQNKLATISGTSMAAAHVSGAVALFLAQAPHCAPDEVRLFLKDKSQFTHDGDNPNILGTMANTINQSIYVRELEGPVLFFQNQRFPCGYIGRVVATKCPHELFG
jgi:subtilisin family serine protease